MQDGKITGRVIYGDDITVIEDFRDVLAQYVANNWFAYVAATRE